MSENAAHQAGPSHEERDTPPREYDDTSRRLWERYLAFERAAATITIEYAQHAWTYRRLDQANQMPYMPNEREAVLVLPGLPGQAEHCFEYMDALARNYTVICPSYPASCTRVEDLARGIVAVLDGEGIARAHVLADSYGCMLAQEIAHLAPARLRTLVLEHPYAPHPRQAPGLRLLAVWLTVLPLPVLRWLIRLVCAPYLRHLSAGRAFWRDCFRESIAQLSRRDYLARLWVLLDYDKHGRATITTASLARADAAIPVLLIEAEADTLVSRADQERMRASFPLASVATMVRASHLGALADPARYLAVIQPFLAGDGSHDGREPGAARPQHDGHVETEDRADDETRRRTR